MPYRNSNPKSRRRNPVTGRQLFVVGGLVLIGGLIASTAFAKPRGLPRISDLPPPPPPDACAPYTWDDDRVRAAIHQHIDEGSTDPAFVASEVASELYGTHPDGVAVTFPPGPEPLPGVECVWLRVVTLVDDIFNERNVTTGDDVIDVTDPVSFVTRRSNDPGYPWTEPTLHHANWPTPGMFLDLNLTPSKDGTSWDPKNGFDSMIRAALGSALVMAGNDPGLATSTGTLGKRLRREYRQLITQPGSWNDRIYGQTNANFAGGCQPGLPGFNADRCGGPNNVVDYMMNDQGRGLNWLPRHANNLERMARGEPAKRTTTLDGQKLSPPNRGNRQMLVWITAVDLDALSPDAEILHVSPLRWPDGSSTVNPPPVIQALGIDMSGVQLPGLGGGGGLGVGGLG